MELEAQVDRLQEYQSHIRHGPEVLDSRVTDLNRDKGHDGLKGDGGSGGCDLRKMRNLAKTQRVLGFPLLLVEVSRETCSGAALALRELIPSFFFYYKNVYIKVHKSESLS